MSIILRVFTFLFAVFFAAVFALAFVSPNFETQTLKKEIAEDIKKEKPIKITIEFWGLWDNSDDWEKIIKKFEEEKTYKINGRKANVFINYTKKDYNSYQKELAKAKQKDGFPSIFFANSNLLAKFSEFLESFEKYCSSKENSLNCGKIMNEFYKESLNNISLDGKLYGLPMYSDSLAIYYNKDLFEKFGVKNSPKTWDEFGRIAKKLTILDNNRKIIQSGAAFGCGSNVNLSSDILTVIAMQYEAESFFDKYDFEEGIDIRTIVKDALKKRDVMKKAVEFYTKFCDSNEEFYSWDRDKEDSVLSFVNEKTAMMINYSYQMKNLEAMNSNLNYGVSQMPQVSNDLVNINFSNVWAPVVYAKNSCEVYPIELSKYVNCGNISWDFLVFASSAENSKIYTDSTGKTSSRKDAAEKQTNSETKKSVFAQQAKNAFSYTDFSDKTRNAIVNMIDRINLDRMNLEKTVDNTIIEIENFE